MSYQRDVRRAVARVMYDYEKYRKSRRLLQTNRFSELFLMAGMILSAVLFGVCLAGVVAPLQVVFPMNPTMNHTELQQTNAVLCGLALAMFGCSIYGLITGYFDTNRLRDSIKDKYPEWNEKPELDESDDL